MLQDVSNDEQPVAMASSPDGPLVALAFKLEEGRFGQLTYMRIYNGTVRKGDFVTNITTGKQMKVSPWNPIRFVQHSWEDGCIVIARQI